jgi:hypothetical protein
VAGAKADQYELKSVKKSGSEWGKLQSMFGPQGGFAAPKKPAWEKSTGKKKK